MLVAEEGQQPADGAREGDVGAVPAHGLVEAQGGQQPWQRLEQDGGRRATCLAHHGDDIAAAVDLAHLQLPDRHAFAAGEAIGSGGGAALRGKGARRGRTLDRLLQVGLAG